MKVLDNMANDPLQRNPLALPCRDAAGKSRNVYDDSRIPLPLQFIIRLNRF